MAAVDLALPDDVRIKLDPSSPQAEGGAANRPWRRRRWAAGDGAESTSAGEQADRPRSRP